MTSLFNEFVTIISLDGAPRGQIGAVVDKNSIVTADTSLLVEVGDTIERDLPHGKKETFSVTHVQFNKGLATIPDFYEITIGGPDASSHVSDQSRVSVHVSGSPNARVNFNSVDNSNNVVNNHAHELFQEARRLLETSVEDTEERELLLQSVDEMESAHGDGDFVSKYKSFMAFAADHMAVLSPVIPGLASLL